ncbi:MAG: tyrosine--tRNA ligase [Thaumarchaeota archaeon]|nr:tyrosine--tRNA ligase [Nitrososphaerota archaeon]
MIAEEVIADLRRQDIEILTEERLTKIVNELPKPVTYIGFEPSNVFHIGNLSASIPVFKLAKHGFRAIILLADLHALANDKGEMSEIKKFALGDKEMLEKIAAKMGIGGKLEYKFGTEFEDQKYFIQMLRLSRVINFTEAEKSMDEISKSSVSRMTSSLIYPLMQVLDIGELGVNVAVGAIDQRKVHVLAIENLKKLGYPTPVAIHSKVILQGTDGKRKMSKSFGNTIDLVETQDSLEVKIRKTFCSPGEIEINPILGWYRALLFPVTEGPISFGQKEISSYPILEEVWAKKELTPQELKQAAVRDLGTLLLD